MKTKGFFIIPVVMAAAFSALVALLLFSQSAKAYAQATNPPPLELGDFLFEPPDGVVPVNEEIRSTLSFTDPGALDADLTFYWDWGDGTKYTYTCPESSECSIDNYGVGEISDTHAYQYPGVYTLQLTVSDTYGQSGSANEYIIAYDPSAGFVTGSGWIMSPEGACQFEACTNDTTGKATFGFVSKYKKGAATPTGQTEFQFKAGNLNFHSDSYEWLVVAGPNAKYKGVGTINGSGNYGFMLTAKDSEINGGGDVDTFRIKIWDKDNGDAVVYDNKMGTSDDSYDGTELGGGNIKIHKGK
jgi:hypothetical protein